MYDYIEIRIKPSELIDQPPHHQIDRESSSQQYWCTQQSEPMT